MKKLGLSIITGMVFASSLMANYAHDKKIAKMYGPNIYVMNKAEKNDILKVFHLPKNRVEFIGKKKTSFGMIEYILKDKMSSQTQIIYYFPKEKVYFIGYVINKNSKNLTRGDLIRYNKISAERQAKIDMKKNLKRLKAIEGKEYQDVIVYHFKGEGMGSIILFTDPACPFCRRFEKLALSYIAKHYGDITLVLFPLKNIHPEALKRTVYFYEHIGNTKNAEKAFNILEQASFLPFNQITKNLKKDKNYEQDYKKIDTLTDALEKQKSFYYFGVPTVLDNKGRNIRIYVTKAALFDLIQKIKAERQKQEKRNEKTRILE